MKSLVLLVALIVLSTINGLKIHIPNHYICNDQDRNIQACEMLYKPVCGVSKSINPKTGITYSNGCLACLNKNVVSYIEGACEKLIGGRSNDSIDVTKTKIMLNSACMDYERGASCEWIYEPVCGYGRDRLSGWSSGRTFQNRCYACRESYIEGVREGAC